MAAEQREPKENRASLCNCVYTAINCCVIFLMYFILFQKGKKKKVVIQNGLETLVREDKSGFPHQSLSLWK